jgi:hypothetical protein
MPVVGEGWHREVSPYPDLRPILDPQRGKQIVETEVSQDWRSKAAGRTSYRGCAKQGAMLANLGRPS